MLLTGCSLRCQWGADRKANALGARGGALQRGHGAPLEALAQLDDAHRGVGAVTLIIETEERVAAQAAKGRRSVNGPLTEKRTLRAAAHLSEVTALRLSPSQSLVKPLEV